MYFSVKNLGEGNLMMAVTAAPLVGVVLEREELDVIVEWRWLSEDVW